jgi:hypothetical protein
VLYLCLYLLLVTSGREKTSVSIKKLRLKKRKTSLANFLAGLSKLLINNRTWSENLNRPDSMLIILSFSITFEKSSEYLQIMHLLHANLLIGSQKK